MAADLDRRRRCAAAMRHVSPVREDKGGARGEVEARVDVEQVAGDQAIGQLFGDAEDVGEAEVRVGAGGPIHRDDRTAAGDHLGGESVKRPPCPRR